MWALGFQVFGFSGFFQGFSGRVVWKTIRAGLPHLFAPIQSSGNQNLTNFVLIFIFFELVWPPKVWKSNFFLLFFQKQASKPCPDCRSRRELSIGTRNTSKDLNLTDLVSKQGRDFHFFSDTRYLPRNWWVALEESPWEKWETMFTSFLVTESIGFLSFDHFPFFLWCSSCTNVGQQDKRPAANW